LLSAHPKWFNNHADAVAAGELLLFGDFSSAFTGILTSKFDRLLNTNDLYSAVYPDSLLNCARLISRSLNFPSMTSFDALGLVYVPGGSKA
jgi:hypothetical protein